MQTRSKRRKGYGKIAVGIELSKIFFQNLGSCKAIPGKQGKQESIQVLVNARKRKRGRLKRRLSLLAPVPLEEVSGGRMNHDVSTSLP